MGPYTSFLLLLVAVLIDRFLLKRHRIVLRGVGPVTIKDGQFLFPLDYTVKSRRKHDGFVRYQLRDANKPTMVIKGKSRSLNFAKRGEHCEYLAINQSQIKEAGTWILDVQITHGESFWNPLYKIYPITETQQRNYELGDA